jgi:hypothetical protein
MCSGFDCEGEGHAVSKQMSQVLAMLCDVLNYQQSVLVRALHVHYLRRWC